jgi:DMSO/TMAO reductase YedYZ molybdopterin-dependent catalytic subunit
MLDRRQCAAGVAAATAGTFGRWTNGFCADAFLPLPGGPDTRPITNAFPQKCGMILQRTRPPLLETPFDVFDQGVFTPNDRTYVRWHWAGIPTEIDTRAYRLTVRGAVNQTLSLSLDDLRKFPEFEVVAVNQCTGNSRGFFQPRVAGGQWANGAMANARWTGVRLKDVLDRAGVKAAAVQLRFRGLDEALADGPKFMKSLSVDKARDEDVMIAWAMNGEALPFLNGYPIRLVVPGWFATYWMKMLSDIEVLTAPDDNYWMATAYRIPDTAHADIAPGQTGRKNHSGEQHAAALVHYQHCGRCAHPARTSGKGARYRIRRRHGRGQSRVLF